MPELTETVQLAISEMLAEESENVLTQSEPIGHSIISGIITGFNEMLPELTKTVTEAMQGVAAAAMATLQIASPSKVFRDKVGKNIALGIGVGLDDEMPNVIDDMRRYSRMLADTAEKTASYNINSNANKNNESLLMQLAGVIKGQNGNNQGNMPGSTSGVAPINIVLEPSGDLRGFFEYISMNIKRYDNLGGVKV